MANSTPIDELTIEIDAKANDANSAIESLCKKIDILTAAISKVDVGKLNSLGNGIKRLGDSLQTMKSVDTRSINSVVNKINSLSAIDTSQFATVSANLHQMANGINSLGTVSANAASVGELAKNISKLGNKSVQTAVTNIPQLATALNGLMGTLSHAPKVSQNVIQMTNALANLTAQGSKVGSASNSIVKGLNRASASATKAKGSFKGLASAFGGFYANCYLVIRGVKSLWNSINSTADYLEAFNYFEVALNKVGSDWASDYEKYGYASAEEYANSFKTRLNESLSGLSGVQISVDANGETGLLTDTGMKNLGLNIQEVTQYASQLASVTNSVGQTGEVTLATASAFTKLGADMSSLFNVDYSSVMNNLQSGLIGQSRALYKYGIDITNATLQTYAYDLGVEKAVSEMTQAEKMQLRMIAILDQSKVAWGDQANTINSLSNSIRQFKNNISEAGQILGQLFVPIMSKLMPIINGVTIAIKRLMVSIAGLFGIKLDLSEFGQGTSGLEDDIDGITDAYDDATASAEKLKKATTTLGIDELNINSPQTDTSSGSSSGASGGGGLDLTDEILKATSEYEKAWKEAYDRMENMALGFANKITNALEPVKKIFEDIAIGDWFSVGEDTSQLISDIFIFISDAIEGVDWEKVGENIGTFLKGIKWLEVMESLKNVIWSAVKAALKVWFGAFKEAPFETSLITAMALWKFTNIGSSMSSKIASALKAKGVSTSGLPVTLGAVALAWEAGFDFGKELGKFLFPEDAEYYDNFKWFGEGGFFEEFFNFDNLTAVLRDLKNAILSLFGLVSDIPDFNKAMEDISLGALYTDKQLLEIQTTYGLTIEQMEQLRQAMLDANPELKNLSENYEALSGASAETLQQVREGLGYISSGVIESGEAYDFLSEYYTGMTQDALSFFESVQNGSIEATEALGVMKESTKNLGAKIKKTIVTTESDITDFFNNSSIYKAKGIELGENIGNGIAQGIGNATQTITAKINNIVGSVQNVLNNSFGFGVELAQIPQYETGGFPEDGLFFANHNELVGTFSNGKTAVANNEDILGGIKQGVKEGVAEILTPYLAEIAQNTRETADKDYSVAIGDKEIYKANLRGAKASGRLLIT